MAFAASPPRLEHFQENWLTFSVRKSVVSKVESRRDARPTATGRRLLQGSRSGGEPALGQRMSAHEFAVRIVGAADFEFLSA